MGNSKDRAKRLLVHYFSVMAREVGIGWDADNISEIESIVDLIFEGVAEDIASGVLDVGKE